MASIDMGITLKGREDLNRILKELNDPKLVNRAIKKTGDNFALPRIRQNAPSKTGKLRASLNGRRKTNGKYMDYYITPQTGHGRAIWGYSLHGTSMRFRTYKDRSKGIHFKSPASTGIYRKNQWMLKNKDLITTRLAVNLRLEINKIK